MVNKIKDFIFTLFVFFHLYSCGTSRSVPKELPPPIGVKETSLEKKSFFDLSTQSNGEQLFFKKRNIVLKETDKSDKSGSLYELDNVKNDLYGSMKPDRIGRIVDVALILPEGYQQEKKEEKPTKEDAGEVLESSIMSQFPDLQPPDSGELKIKDKIKMRIAQRFSNGDLMIVYHRESKSDQEVKAMNITARVAYQNLVSLGGITSEDLFDVNFKQTIRNRDDDGLLNKDDGLLDKDEDLANIERYSNNWELEYTLRVSGFSEAKSKAAMDLEDKRKALVRIRKGLIERLKSIQVEREKSRKQQNKITSEKNEIQNRLNELEKQVEESSKQQEENNLAVKSEK